jgi:hypothetical protein
MNGKRLSLAAVISLTMLTLWGIAGCSKNNSSSTASEGTMTATVNGTAYTAKAYVIAGYLTSYGQIIVQGDSINNNDTTEIQVAMPYPPAVNVPISTDSTQFAAVTYVRGGVEYDAFNGYGYSHGVITLSSADTVNHRVIGTFSGVVYNTALSTDSVVLTNGTFNSTYSVQ